MGDANLTGSGLSIARLSSSGLFELLWLNFGNLANIFFVTLGPLLLVQRSAEAYRRPGGHVWALALEEQVQALWGLAVANAIAATSPFKGGAGKLGVGVETLGAQCWDSLVGIQFFSWGRERGVKYRMLHIPGILDCTYHLHVSVSVCSRF